MIKEIIYNDVDLFLSLLDKNSRIHYELYWKPARVTHGLIEILEVGLNLYGVSKEGYILLCKVYDTIDWDSEILNKYEGSTLHQKYSEFIKEKWKEYKAIAEEIGATEGKFEYVAVRREAVEQS